MAVALVFRVTLLFRSVESEAAGQADTGGAMRECRPHAIGWRAQPGAPHPKGCQRKLPSYVIELDRAKKIAGKTFGLVQVVSVLRQRRKRGVDDRRRILKRF